MADSGRRATCADRPAPRRWELDELGPAVEGFAVNAAILVVDELHVVSMDLDPLRILRVDPAATTVIGQAEVPGATRAWACTSLEGELWLGLWNRPAGQPNLCRFDPGTGAVRLVTRVPSDHEFWDLAATPDGVLVAGTDRAGVVSTYDPATARPGRLTFPADEGSHVAAVATDDTTVFAGTSRRGARIVALPRAGGSIRELLPDGVAEGVYTLERAADLLIAGLTRPGALALVDLATGATTVVAVEGHDTVDAVRRDGSVIHLTAKPAGSRFTYDLDRGELSEHEPAVPYASTRALLRHGGTLLGVSSVGVVWRLDGGTVTGTDLLDAGAPSTDQAVMSLVATAGRVCAGGNHRLQIRELATGAVRRATVPGEPKAIAAVGERLWLAVYPYALLLAYDLPDGPVRQVAAWEPTLNRPRALAPMADGRLLVGAWSDVERHGGLVTVDPAAGTVDVEIDPLDGQSVESLAVAGDEVYLAGNGADASLVARRGDRQRWATVPVPGGGAITGLAVWADAVHLLTDRGHHAMVDRADGRTHHRQRLLEGSAGELAVTRGRLWAVSRDRLIATRPHGDRAQVVADDLHARLYERARVAVDGDCDLHVVSGRGLLRVRAVAADA